MQVRELVQDFFSAQYTSCLDRLKRLRPQLALDMHLHAHVDTLIAQIRSRALTQYTTPFSSVDLRAMAGAFNTDVR